MFDGVCVTCYKSRDIQVGGQHWQQGPSQLALGPTDVVIYKLHMHQVLLKSLRWPLNYTTSKAARTPLDTQLKKWDLTSNASSAWLIIMMIGPNNYILEYYANQEPYLIISSNKLFFWITDCFGGPAPGAMCCLQSPNHLVLSAYYVDAMCRISTCAVLHGHFPIPFYWMFY